MRTKEVDVAKATCSIDGCDKPAIAKTWCDRHYRIAKRNNGDPLYIAPKREKKICVIESCDQHATRWGGKLHLCSTHWNRWSKGQDMHATTRQIRGGDEQCAAEDCDQPRVTRGYCDKHYRRWLTHGDVTVRLYGGNPRQGECRIDGCDGTSIAWNLCEAHYRRWAKWGDPEFYPDLPTVQRHREDVETHGVLVIVDTKGVEHRVLFDYVDTNVIEGYRWYVSPTGYVTTGNGDDGTVFLARIIMGLKKGDERVVDHASGHTLDNRRANLRVTTPLRNVQNQPIVNDRGSSKYRGVHYDKARGAWTAASKDHGRPVHIGRFSTEEAAGQAVQRYREQHDVWPGYWKTDEPA